MEMERWQRRSLLGLLVPLACAQASTTGLDGGPEQRRPEDASQGRDAELADSGFVAGEEAVRLYRAYCESVARREEELKTECVGGPPEIWTGQNAGRVELCVDALKGGLERGVWTIDTGALGACRSGLRAVSCEWLRRPSLSSSIPPEPTRATPCPEAMIWAAPDDVGAACDFLIPSTCGPNGFCAPRGSACGECIPTQVLREGESCLPSSATARCAAGFECSTSERICRRRPSGIGDACDGLSCAPFGFCPTEGRRTCQAFRALGEPCQYDGECGRNLRCVLTGPAAGTCQRYPSLGSTCRSERDCEPPFTACIGPLDDGRCVPAPGLGERCQRRTGSSFVCAVGVCRGREGVATCQPWGALGETCVNPDECAPGLQCSGSCTAAPGACPD